MELVYSNDLSIAENTLGYPLVSGPQQVGEIVEVNEPQRFTLLSVVGSLEKAVLADRASAQAEGRVFDRAGWAPSPAVVEQVSAEHRIHRHYLRGIAGLKLQLAEMEAGLWDNGEPFYEHQLEGIRRLIVDMEGHDPLAQSSHGSYFNISGGGGKSRMIAMTVIGFKRFDVPEDPAHVLFVAHDNTALAEVVGADGQSGFGKYAQSLDVGVVNKDSKEYDHEVVGTTIAMLRRLAPVGKEADTAADEPAPAGESFIAPYALVVSDESHRLLGEVSSKTIQAIPRRVYGFTGSDRYSDKRKVSDLLPTELMSVGTYELIMRDDLAPLQFWICKTNEVIHRDSGRADYSQAELDRIALMSDRHQIAADLGLAFFKDGRNGVFSCNNIGEAEKFARLMSGDVAMPDGTTRPVKVVAVHSKNKQDNNAIFRQLQNDEIQGVTIVNIETAWDVPRVSFMVHLRPRTLVSARQANARLYRRFYDDQGRVMTGQIVDLCDIVDVRKKSGSDIDEPELPVQLFSPMLLGRTVYRAGMLVASPASEGKRHDFELGKFPPHIRRALTVTDGVSMLKLAVFGAGAVREKTNAPDDYLTLYQARIGLGVSATRLQVAIISQNVPVRDGKFINQKGVDRLAQHFTDTCEPII